MKVTERDVRLVRDIALSHVMCRDQAIRLGYFGSVTRANCRLKALNDGGYLRVAPTPFHSRFLYVPGIRSGEVTGERIAALVSGRKGSPKFLRHALATTEVRIALTDRGYEGWRFEAQVSEEFVFEGRRLEFRPDGLFLDPDQALFIEIDLGNVSTQRIGKKLASYSGYLESGSFRTNYGGREMKVLFVTTGNTRVQRIRLLAERAEVNGFACTFGELGAEPPGGWS